MRKTGRVFALLALAAALMLPSLVLATVWDTMHFQGILLNSDGTRVDGLKNVTFSIWDAETEGSKFWEEAKLLDINDGVVSVELGSTTPLSSLTGLDQYWLQIQVTGDDPMPRIKMTGVPYALSSRYVQGYGPGNSTLDIPINNGTLNVNLNADKVDGYNAGNDGAEIPINNGTLNANLNADLVDGMNADEFATAGHTHDHTTITDDAGVGYDGDSTTVAITTSATTVLTGGIVAPAAGFALVIATSEFAVTNASADAAVSVGVTKTEGTLPIDGDPSWVVPAAIAGDVHHNVITVQHVFPVISGSNNFYFQAVTDDAGTTATAANSYMSIIYFPVDYTILK
jgi:hypothetical protein